eukprot:GHVR01040976.1.p1 GENE.GHVR01040976.1~~GHVR01040976.1.p1  ORF type:complete len:275 (+),score=37.79 GHVR01040976.1:873-1697(+)
MGRSSWGRSESRSKYMPDPKPKEKEEIILPPKHVDHKNIYAALSALQGELKPMEKTGTVSFKTRSGDTLEFKYTPLGEIMTVLYPILAKHGLSVRHEIQKEGVEAIVTHETYEESTEAASKIEEVGIGEGKKIDTTFVKITKNQIRSGVIKIGQGGEMKDVGAAITYAKRYSLTAVLGISSEEDKDAALLDQTAENAMMNVMKMSDMKIKNAKTEADLKKIIEGFEKDLKQIEGGKAPALGLKKDQYEILIGQANLCIRQLKDRTDVTVTPTEE